MSTRHLSPSPAHRDAAPLPRITATDVPRAAAVLHLAARVGRLLENTGTDRLFTIRSSVRAALGGRPGLHQQPAYAPQPDPHGSGGKWEHPRARAGSGPRGAEP
ncbi:hypothetical protein [Kitasatospora sp. KL5]|uniref:hypothetical protein n=1 Tax=Kitasatospora sp. KL5 TaxID=3425125 RepID=UPI003D6FE1CF